MSYLLDANVFIEAKNRYYAFDVVPAFWEWLDDAHAEGLVHSVRKIREELLDGADELADWVHHREDFFLEPDDAVVESLRQVTHWALNADPPFAPAARTEFLSAGDSFLVAHAHAHQRIVVTHERYAETVKKIKIPNACAGMGVEYMGPFEMLRREGARFG